MSTATQEFSADAIGAWGDADEFVVERDRIKAYAAATNDTIPQHTSGDIAPPVFGFVAGFGALTERSVSVIPGELLMAVLHGEQDFRYRKPIEPGMTLATRAAVLGFEGRSSGVTVTIKAETRDKETDELLVEQFMIPFIRGAEVARSLGDPAPEHKLDESLRGSEPVAEVRQTFDADQTFRYSEASGDPMPIHLDDEMAKSMGLPGIIIHGLCTMAFTSVAVVEHACLDDPTRLKRLAVRFSRTVQPEQEITTRIWDSGPGDSGKAYAFETTSDSGDTVIKDGLAEVA